MHYADQNSSASPITAMNDSRVFTLGVWLRRLKIDELPQLINVLRGEMSIVGPRPEDPLIVNKYYSPDHYSDQQIDEIDVQNKNELADFKNGLNTSKIAENLSQAILQKVTKIKTPLSIEGGVFVWLNFF